MPSIFAQNMELLNYEDTLTYLYAQLPMFSRIGAAAYKADLTNTILLSSAFGNPQHKFKSVHIAGTNGKGSTSHMLAAVLQQAGYKVGLYTSPHLVDFRERIKINGEYIPKEFVVEFTNKSTALIKDISPSFFELTVIMAFEYFAQEKVDIAVIETGLGGRLDSTNIIQPLLSIITNIGWDHQAILGNTLEKIASEKAGIIKAHTPVVLSELQPEIFHVFEQKAHECNAKLTVAEKEVSIKNVKSSISELCFEATYNNHHYNITTDLTAGYQIKNSRAVIAACKLLNDAGLQISQQAILEGLANVKKITGLRGRWEVLDTNPTIIADVAHNVDGMQQLLTNLNTLKNVQPNAAIHFIIGMVKDKDVEAVLALLPKDATYYFTNANIPRALAADKLQYLGNKMGLIGEYYSDVNSALSTAKTNADGNDIIIVCGSVFLVGELHHLKTN